MLLLLTLRRWHFLKKLWVRSSRQPERRRMRMATTDGRRVGPGINHPRPPFQWRPPRGWPFRVPWRGNTRRRCVFCFVRVAAAAVVTADVDGIDGFVVGVGDDGHVLMMLLVVMLALLMLTLVMMLMMMVMVLSMLMMLVTSMKLTLA